MTERHFVQHNAMIFREATETFLQEEDDMADPHVIHPLVTTCVLRSLARYQAGPISPTHFSRARTKGDTCL